MKRNELIEARDLGADDIATRIGDLEQRLFHLKFQMAIEGERSNAEYARSRKSLAQYKTLLHEKELAGAGQTVEDTVQEDA